VAVILIVDGVAESRRLLESMVEDLGHVLLAEDAASAIAQAQAHWPDLVLLDATAPGVDGGEICRQVRAQEHTRLASVIFVTDDEGREAEGLGPGAIDYVRRPLKRAIVRARVQNHLALVRARLDLRIANEALQRIAVTDSLTGLATRRRLIEVGAQELARAQRMPRIQSLICALVIDIDNLKAINERDGQPAGDAVIRAVAQTCAQTIRTVDTMGRLAGEEFGIVLPMTDCKGGVELAERLRDRIARSLAVTVSLGVAQGTPKTRSFEALLGAADEALGRAKKAGGNRVAATIYGNAEDLA
jgi:two-component system cell cycle response regulator